MSTHRMRVVLAFTLSMCTIIGQSGTPPLAAQGAQVEAPIFEVDPFWPKPFPNNQVMGFVLGMEPDEQNNVWVLNRPDRVDPIWPKYVATREPWPENLERRATPAEILKWGNRIEQADRWVQAATHKDGRCCSPYPWSVLHFDQAGNLIGKWGDLHDSSEKWLFAPHGLTYDYKGNLWISSTASNDSRVAKFTKDGKFLLALGTRGVMGDSNDRKNLAAPGSVTIDPETNEAYVSDGSINRRIIVFDADTGAYKRHWGAYGKPPIDYPNGGNRPGVSTKGTKPGEPLPQGFNSPHCAVIARDGFVYVCDWLNNRIQVFRKNGTFVKEQFIEGATAGQGTVWDAALSRDAQQRYLYVADGENRKIHVLLRETLETLYSFGGGGIQPGQFVSNIHNIQTDLTGNLYTGENGGGRVQRFLFKGVGPVKARSQQYLWPDRR